MNTMLKWAMVAAAGYVAYKASASVRARNGMDASNSLGLAPEDLSATRYNAGGLNGRNNDADASLDSGVYPTSADKRFGSSSSAAAI